MSRTSLLLLSAAALLSACGKVGPLSPAPGVSLPPKTYAQDGAVDPQALLEPSTQARPSRVDELLQRSEPRAADPFDLPPAGRPVVNTDEADDDATIPTTPED